MAKSTYRIKPVQPNPDFVKKENSLLDKWYRLGIVRQYLEKNSRSSKHFSFIDGPITANNPMGVHHAWGRTYKDIWQRYKNMQGCKQRFQNGFDSQGLWVEVEVEKELGFKSKKDIESYGVEKFVQKCKDRVIKYSKIQTRQSKRLGYLMDWENSYYTMSDENNYMIWHFLKVCHQNGWIYKGNDSVPWCPRCQTAISQHEMLTEDYKLITHDSIYLSLPIIGRENEFLLIWTTTPWTIPANTAVAVKAKIKYTLVQTDEGKRYWVAKDLQEKIFLSKDKVIKTVFGKELVGLKYRSPFDDLPAVKKIAKANPDNFHLVVATDPLILPISSTEGTGLVHLAISAGSEDFKLGKKYSLPLMPVIADNANYLKDLGFLTGKNAKKHPEIILDYLQDQDKQGASWVFKIEAYKHRYPACWRCKEELVWKVTDEWYIAMDKGKDNLRQRMIKVAKTINWKPAFGLDRELDWLANMHDWLISKQNRYWGLSLPIWECQCGYFEVIGSKEEMKKKAVSGWDQFIGHSPHKPFIDKIKIKCPRCHKPISRIEPVGNPWLDAGIVPFSTLNYLTDKSYFKRWFPADFITESFPGQFKNWFYSLIAMSSVLENKKPVKNILGFATMLDSKGKAFHKSAGNSIEFIEAADRFSADVIRWFSASQPPARDIWFGQKQAQKTKRQFHMFLWNSYRFFANFASLENWRPSKIEEKNLTSLDIWILQRLRETIITVSKNLDRFNAHNGAKAIESLVSDLSGWYIRRSRQRIGPAVLNKKDKNSCYQTLYQVLETLSRLLMPYTPFIADEIYTNLTGKISVNLADWPKRPAEKDINQRLLEQMVLVRKICELGHAQRKEKELAVKQPLNSILVKVKNSLAIDKDETLLQLIKEELNIEKVVIKQADSLSVDLNTRLTASLIKKRQAREIIRQIQQARKEANCKLDQLINITLPDWPKKYEKQIKQKTLTASIVKGKRLTIKK